MVGRHTIRQDLVTRGAAPCWDTRSDLCMPQPWVQTEIHIFPELWGCGNTAPKPAGCAGHGTLLQAAVRQNAGHQIVAVGHS